jgi:hypothetical protein
VYLKVQTDADIDRAMDLLRASAHRVRDWVAAQSGDPLDLLRRMKHDEAGEAMMGAPSKAIMLTIGIAIGSASVLALPHVSRLAGDEVLRHVKAWAVFGEAQAAEIQPCSDQEQVEVRLLEAEVATTEAEVREAESRLRAMTPQQQFGLGNDAARQEVGRVNAPAAQSAAAQPCKDVKQLRERLIVARATKAEVDARIARAVAQAVPRPSRL